MNYKLLFRYSPDDGAGSGGSGGDGGAGAGAGDGGSGGGASDAKVTLTEKEFSDRLTKQYQNGMAEREKRIYEQQIPEILKKHNIPVGKTFEETIAGVAEILSKTTKDVDQRILDSEVKIKTLATENEQWANRFNDKVSEVDNYIINGELQRAIGSKAMDSARVARLMRDEYKIEKSNDGKIHIINKSTGETIYDKKSGDPITLDQLADKFLNENQWMMKTENRGGTGGGDRTGITTNNIEAIQKKAEADPNSLSDAERKSLRDYAAALSS